MTSDSKLTGADVAVEALLEAGIDTVFGVPGLHTLALWDALAARPQIRTVVTRHEQAAAMSADGYARATGRPAAVLAITGPGATNTLTGVATAYADSVPMVVLTGQVALPLLGRDTGSTHELPDQQRLFTGITAFSRTVTSPDHVREAVRAAIAVLRSERPRPVHVELPVDVQEAELTSTSFPLPTPCRPTRPDDATAGAIAELLRSADRPLIYAGGGAIDAAAAVRELADATGAAVLTTPTARGIVPDDHPMALGCAWTKATRDGPVGPLLASCDVMLSIGTSFAANPTGSWTLPVPEALIHVDLDSRVLNRHYPAAIAVHGHASETVQTILGAFGKAKVPNPGFAREVTETRRAVRDACPAPARIRLDAVREGVGRDGIVVTDVTVLAYHAGTYLPVYAPRTYLAPAKFGTLGYGLPAAVGAKLGRPEAAVASICGDGGLMLNLHELATAVQERLGIAIVVHDDGGYGAIRHSQDLRYGGRRIGTELHVPDLAALASAFGAHHEAPDAPKNLGSAIAKAVRADRPTLITWTDPLPFPW